MLKLKKQLPSREENRNVCSIDLRKQLLTTVPSVKTIRTSHMGTYDDLLYVFFSHNTRRSENKTIHIKSKSMTQKAQK